MPYKWLPNMLYLKSVLLKTLGNSVGEVCIVVNAWAQAIVCLGPNLSFLCYYLLCNLLGKITKLFVP